MLVLSKSRLCCKNNNNVKRFIVHDDIYILQRKNMLTNVSCEAMQFLHIESLFLKQDRNIFISINIELGEILKKVCDTIYTE